MVNIHIEFDELLRPLKWAGRKAGSVGILGKFVLLCGGVGYLLTLVLFAIIILPFLWLYEKLI